MIANVKTLDDLIYSNDLEGGTFRMYVYTPSGHGYEVREYFRKHVKYPDEEISAQEAKELFDIAMEAGREIRITNGSDFLVFHSRGGQVIYPESGSDGFWKRVMEAS